MTQTRELYFPDREITDKNEIRFILENAAICRLGFAEKGIPYVIPFNYGFTYENDIITLFFHCAPGGRKLDIIKDNPLVCFETDYIHNIDPDENPDRNSKIFESIVGTGKIQEVTELKEKVSMLEKIIEVFAKYNPVYKPKPLTEERVAGAKIRMLKLVLDEYKAKRIFHL